MRLAGDFLPLNIEADALCFSLLGGIEYLNPPPNKAKGQKEAYPEKGAFTAAVTPNECPPDHAPEQETAKANAGRNIQNHVGLCG